MTQIRSDNPAEIELQKVKGQVQSLELELKKLVVSFPHLPPKERALALTRFETQLQAYGQFFVRVSAGSFINAGAKFTYENAKQLYQTIQTRWRIFHHSL